jgi:diamine N-acetyltransferase
MTHKGLAGNRVRLRALEPGDVDLLYTWENDTSIWEVSNTLAPFSRFQLEEYVLNARNDIFAARQLRLMIDLIEPQKNEKSIGTIDLFDFEPFHYRAGVGILVREDYQKNGFAREALEILISYAFGNLRLHQLYCNISTENTTSLHLFEKLGFKRCGIKKDWIYQQDKWKDEWMYQLIDNGK